MRIVVIGGSGRIGRKVAGPLAARGCDAVAACPSSGVDVFTGAGQSRVLNNANVVVDCSNSPTVEGAPNFFARATHNLLAAEESAGVCHHVLLSIVGLERLLDGVYFRAKKIQEEFVGASGIPFTILRSTQFFDLISGVVQEGGATQIPIAPALVQPIDADDVARFLARAALDCPINTAIEIAGPEQFRLDDLAAEMSTLWEDLRSVVTDRRARYFGVELGERTLLPGPDASIGPTRFDDWLRSTLQPAIAALKPFPVALPTAAGEPLSVRLPE